MKEAKLTFRVEFKVTYRSKTRISISKNKIKQIKTVNI